MVVKLGYTRDFCQENRCAYVRPREVTEDDAKNADYPYSRVYLTMIGRTDEPLGKDGYPALMCEGFDEDELGEGEWDEGEWKSGKSGEECWEVER